MSRVIRKGLASIILVLVLSFIIAPFISDDNVIEASAAATCRVTYSPMNGTQPWTVTKTVGASYGTLPSATKTGYTFLGWYTGTSSGTKVTSTTRVPNQSSITLYARWSKQTYKLTYSANGGTGAPSAQSQQHGGQFTVSSAKPTRTGYTFLGWSTSSAATTSSYLSGAKINASKNITLYAVWKKNTYTITYNANGGTNAPAKQTKTYGVSLKLTTAKPTRTGHTFLGWSTSSAATTAQYSAGATYTANANATLYAVWKKNTYTITYNANGGTGAPAKQTKTYGVSLKLNTAKPTRTGHTFLGWSTSSVATTAQYVSGATYTANANATLYAVWKRNTYKLTYSANGGTGAPAAQSQQYGGQFTVSSAKPTRTGYTFLGWSTSSTATTSSLLSGAKITASKNITLYAVWKKNTYTITYNANGGTGAPAKQTKTYGVSLKLNTAKPTRTGHTFLGWSTSSTATTAQYVAGATYTANANATLYAVWKKNTYKLTYNANGGTGAPSAQSQQYGGQFTVSSAKPTRTGYTFLGWSTSSAATTSSYLSGAKITASKNITLYAVWKKNTYTITYNANGGTGAPAKQTKTYGVNLTLSGTKPTRTGHTFLGWSTSSTATTAQYVSGATYTANANATLYAVWKKHTYTISYNANGGNGAPASQTKSYGVTLTLSGAKPGRAGYTFLGWSTSSAATTAEYSAAGAFNKNANTTLYAVWKKNTYTITYNANGGTNAPAKQTKTYGDSIVLSSAKPTRTGHTFLGWGKRASDTTVLYAPGATFTDDINITLYAVWKVNSYTITYNANGGTGTPSSQTKKYGEQFTVTSSAPTKSGYSFLGWSTSKQDPDSATSKATYISGNKISASGNITLYAVWRKSYTITYNANGGTGGPTRQTKFHGTNIKLSTLEPTWEHYVFLGWSPDPNAKVSAYLSGGTYTSDSNITLYAVWAPCYYVDFCNDDGSLIERREVLAIAPATIGSLPTLTHESKCAEFVGWYSPVYYDWYRYEEDEVIESDVKLKAKWRYSHCYDSKNVMTLESTDTNGKSKKEIVVKCDNCHMTKYISVRDYTWYKGFYTSNYELDLPRGLYEYAIDLGIKDNDAKRMKELYASYNSSNVSFENMIEAMRLSDEYMKKLNAAVDFFNLASYEDKSYQAITDTVSTIMDKTGQIGDETEIYDGTIFSAAGDIASILGNIDSINNGSGADKINGTIDMLSTMLSYFEACGISIGDLYYGTILDIVKDDINAVLEVVEEKYGNIGTTKYFTGFDIKIIIYREGRGRISINHKDMKPSDYLYMSESGELENVESVYYTIAKKQTDTGMDEKALEAYVMYLLEKEGRKVQTQIDALLG